MTVKLVSIGHLACRLHFDVAYIQRRADEAGVEPAFTINDVVYYDQTGVRAIAEQIMQFEDSVEEAQARNTAFARALLGKER